MLVGRFQWLCLLGLLLITQICTAQLIIPNPLASHQKTVLFTPKNAVEIKIQKISSAILSGADARQSGFATASSPIIDAAATLYQPRQFKPLWTKPGLFEQLLLGIESLTRDGLNPEDYFLTQLRTHAVLFTDVLVISPDALARADMLATEAYLRALFHLYNGKVNPRNLDPQLNFITQNKNLEAVKAVVTETVRSGKIADAIVLARPQHLIYPSLQAGLARYHMLAAQGGWPTLPDGPILKPGMTDPAVAVLRRRLGITGEYPVARHSTKDNPTSLAGKVVSDTLETLVNVDEVFDNALVDAVKRFQREQYLEVDGAIGPSTRVALNISVTERINQIRVNLERARWFLHNIPEDLVLVDIAGFKITYFKHGQSIWQSRVQVGMAYRVTPIFKSEVNYITLNPTWTVPPTILRKDILPKLQKNLDYLKENNMRVLNAKGAELNPAEINWYRPGNIMLRQDAGPKAALGRAVIRFPNDHAIYLHDTPHQELFNKSQRAFSSGCIRVERALELVKLLMADSPKWNSEAIESILALGKTRNISLTKRVPILLAYWTVDAIDENRIAFKPDIYASDPGLLSALDRHY